MGNIFAKQSH